MKKSGFSLVEILVGLLLSSIIGTVLLNTFFQSVRTLRMVDESAELDTGMAVVLNQMERDFAGALVPVYEQEQKKEATEEKEKEKTPEPGKEGAKEGAKKEKAEKKEKKPTFIAKTKNKQLDYVTFLTINPQSRYGAPLPNIAPKPFLVRVMYKLRENPEHKGAFVLLRQESTNLDVASFAKKNEKRPHEVTVSDAVHECLMEFTYREEKEDGKLQTVQEWGAQKAEAQKKEEEIPPLPIMVKLTLTLWDARFEVKRSIEYLLPIYAVYVEPQKQENKKSPVQTMTNAVMPQGAYATGQQPVPTGARPNGAKPGGRLSLADLLGGGRR
jgi:type II secretory pathway component PulJ